MTINGWGLAAALMSLAAFGIASCRGRPLPVRLRIRLTTAACAAALPGLLYAAYYLHLVAVPVWFYELRAAPGSEFLTVFVGLAAGFLSTFAPRPTVPLFFLGAFLASVLPYAKPVLRPLDFATLQDRWQGVACLQTTWSTCGPASAATILHSLGHPVTEAALARESLSCSTGTEAWSLARALRRRGFEVSFVTAPPGSTPVQLPCVVGVLLPGGGGHFIAVLQRKDGRLHVVDPLSGERWLSEAEFARFHDTTGFSMAVRLRAAR